MNRYKVFVVGTSKNGGQGKTRFTLLADNDKDAHIIAERVIADPDRLNELPCFHSVAGASTLIVESIVKANLLN